MTEPEDLEEDLFADLYVSPTQFLIPHSTIANSASLADTDASYDVDDTSTKPQQAAKEEFPEPATTSMPPHNVHDSDQIKQDPSLEMKQEPEDQVNGNYANGHNGDSAMNWNNDHNDGAYGSHYDDGHPEPQGIGIKEDG